jgi:hypothetical protein
MMVKLRDEWMFKLKTGPGEDGLARRKEAALA